mmetsp:Transcript_4456/g.9537  ORF Transcript_4456/g.9537 Transcript_4456/m.9537 type:complete len:214 (+) Transcript_4456:4294-4935(+)
MLIDARLENDAFFLRSGKVPFLDSSSRSSSLSSRISGEEKLISSKTLGFRAVFAVDLDIGDPPAAVSSSNHCSIRDASLFFIALLNDIFDNGITCEPSRMSSVIRGFLFLGLSSSFTLISDVACAVAVRELVARVSGVGPVESFSSSPFPSWPSTKCFATAAAAFANSISDDGFFETPRRNIAPTRLPPEPVDDSLFESLEAVGKSRVFTDCS